MSAHFVNIEISCSDENEHKQRVDSRKNEVENLQLPNWQQVKARHYEAWKTEVVKIDTAADSIETSFAKLVEKLGI